MKMFVELFLTIVAITGVCLFYWSEVQIVWEKIKLRYASKKVSAKVGKSKEEASEDLYLMPTGLNEGIRRLLKICFGYDSKYLSYVFWIVTLTFPATVLFTTVKMLPNLLRFFLALTVAVLPLMLLLAKLQTIRIRSSKEGKMLIIELLDNYKIHYYNMQHAVEITAATIEEAPNCKRLLFNLSKGINRASSNEEIRDLLVDFKYAIGTSWAGILTDNIYFALSSGIRVEAAMEDLVDTLSMAEEVEEKSKRENNEAGLILKYLVPVCYLLTFVGAVKFFGLTPKTFLHYQFGTEAGISWFVIIVIMYIASLAAQFFLTRSKLDL